MNDNQKYELSILFFSISLLVLGVILAIGSMQGEGKRPKPTRSPITTEFELIERKPMDTDKESEKNIRSYRGRKGDDGLSSQSHGPKAFDGLNGAWLPFADDYIDSVKKVEGQADQLQKEVRLIADSDLRQRYEDEMTEIQRHLGNIRVALIKARERVNEGTEKDLTSHVYMLDEKRAEWEDQLSRVEGEVSAILKKKGGQRILQVEMPKASGGLGGK